MNKLFNDTLKVIRMFPHHDEDKIQDILKSHNYIYSQACWEDLNNYINILDRTDTRCSPDELVEKYNLNSMDMSALNNFKE